jgi:hypothetical protein
VTEIERLAAIEEIKQVKSRYFRFGDTKELVSMRELFAPDCVVDLSGSTTDPATGADIFPAVGSQILRGVDAVMEAYGAGEGIRTVHHGYNPEIEITGDTSATAIFSMTDRLFFSDAYPVAGMVGYGHYHETYEKIGGKWLIKTIRLTRLRVEVIDRDGASSGS